MDQKLSKQQLLSRFNAQKLSPLNINMITESLYYVQEVQAPQNTIQENPDPALVRFKKDKPRTIPTDGVF